MLKNSLQTDTYLIINSFHRREAYQKIRLSYKTNQKDGATEEIYASFVVFASTVEEFVAIFIQELLLIIDKVEDLSK